MVPARLLISIFHWALWRRMARPRWLLQRLLLGATGISTVGNAHAQHFPSHEIRLIVPYSAGSGADTYARLIGKQMALTLKQPIVIENHDGAGGIVGATYVARAAPNGYTILFIGTPWAITPYLYRRGGYDPFKDFSLIGRIAFISSMLVVPKKSSITDLHALVTEARRSPNSLTFASSGVGSPSSLAMQYFASRAGISLREIPYKSTAQALQDTIGGQVAMNLPIVSVGAQNLDSGLVRGIAVTGLKRVPIAPDVPTIAESGFPGFDASMWVGLAAPAGTPAPVISLLNQELNRALNDPALRSQLERLGLQVSPDAPDKFISDVKADTAKWAALVKQFNIALQ